MERKVKMSFLKSLFGGGKKKVSAKKDTNALRNDASQDSKRRLKIFATEGGSAGEEVDSVKKRKKIGE